MACNFEVNIYKISCNVKNNFFLFKPKKASRMTSAYSVSCCKKTVCRERRKNPSAYSAAYKESCCNAEKDDVTSTHTVKAAEKKNL